MSKILVVDDDLDILVVMEILLSMKGYEVEVTAKWENTFDKIVATNHVISAALGVCQITTLPSLSVKNFLNGMLIISVYKKFLIDL